MQEIRSLGVIGAGAWGTALAKHLAEKGLEIRLWAYEREVVDSINTAHENRVFLPGVSLPRTLTATTSLTEAIERRDGLLFVVPSHVTRQVLRNLASCLSRPMPLLSATKGIEEDSSKLMTQIMDEVLPESMEPYLMALSGPSFASELSAGKPTAVCLAGRDPQLVARFQAALMTPALRVYADGDLIGLQLGGALKNVMALAAGVVDGLELGHNARAALSKGAMEPLKPGKYVLLQKLYHWAIAGLVFVLMGTGLLMWRKIDTPFWRRDPYMLDEETWGYVYAAHDFCAMSVLAIVAILIYFAARPDKWWQNRSMFTGDISRADYLARHDVQRWKAEDV